MLAYVWSLVDRVMARAINAALSLTLALFLPPELVGEYALSVAALTLIQVVGDVSLRQVAVSVPDHIGLDDRVRKYAYRAGRLGSVTMLAYLACRVAQEVPPSVVMNLLPLALVPLASAGSVLPMSRLQRAGSFKGIALSQVVAATLSTALAFLVLVALRNLLAPAIQYVMAEACLTVLLARRWRNQTFEAATDSNAKGTVTRQLYGASITNLLAWSQSQADRFVVAAFASTSVLGNYSLAVVAARTGTDIVNVALLNVARPRLARARKDGTTRQTFGAALIVVGAVTDAVVLVYIVLFLPLLDRYLSPAYDGALSAIPLLLLASFASSAAWLLSTALLVNEQAMRAIAPQIASVVLGLAVGPAVTYGIRNAALVLVLREVILLPWRALQAREVLSGKALLLWLLTVTPGVLLCLTRL